MQESALVDLHRDLESKVHVRGASGGLGFNAAEAKVAKQAEKKVSKRLRGADDGSRKFSTTSAGAVAAGHWDPWARPVEFKMKAKNTAVGGLYTMFVKGDTMGGSMQHQQAAASDNGGDGEREKKKKKKKDNKRGTADAEGSAGKAKKEKKSKGADAGASASTSNGTPGSFDWESDVLQRLTDAPEGKVEAKKLRKAVLKAARAALGSAAPDDDELKKLYKKTIKKTEGVAEADDPSTGMGVVQLRRWRGRSLGL